MSGVGEAPGKESSVIEVSAFGLSDVGRVRKNNEDNFVICDLTTGELSLNLALRNHALGPRGMLLLVADGMGGEACGELASQICAETVPKRLYENLNSFAGTQATHGMAGQVSETNFVGLLREAIEFANQTIFQKARSQRAYRGMGTTTTAAAFFGANLFVAQVGDSRAYLIRNQEMFQLTRDQTFLNYLADIGAELPADPENDSRKSILTQAVGSSETLDVKLTCAKVRRGDSVFLCSDGLYNMVKLPNMLDIMNGNNSLADKCKSLIATANEHGGSDNITVVMAELTGPGLPPMDPAIGVELQELLV